MDATLWILLSLSLALALGALAFAIVQRRRSARSREARLSALSRLEQAQKAYDQLKSMHVSTLEEMNLLEETINNLKSQDPDQEIEDLEDEIKGPRSRLRDLNAYADDLYDSNQRLMHLEHDLSATRGEMERLSADAAAKDEVISLVNAVLTAPLDNDEQAARSTVDKIESIIYQYYLPWAMDPERRQQVLNITDYWVNLQRKSWLKDTKVIAFIGEFSAGKTSIVNSILRHDNPDCPELPVSGKATTAIPTYISHGPELSARFVDENGDLRQMPTDVFVKIDKDMLSRINVSAIIRYFIVRYANPALQGLTLLDTPGFSSNDPEDRQRTIGAIQEADALFWVMDANVGDLNRSSLSLIANNHTNIPLYVIINKTDTKSPDELTEIDQQIRRTLADAHIPVAGFLQHNKEASIEPILDIIRQAPSSHLGQDINAVASIIAQEIDTLNSQLHKMRAASRNLQSQIEDQEVSVREHLRILMENNLRIKSMPQYNKRLMGLRPADFRLDKTEYFILLETCQSTSEVVKQMYRELDQFKGALSDGQQLSTQVTALKERIRALQEALDQLRYTLNR